MSKSAMIIVPEHSRILNEASELDLRISSNKIYELTSGLTVAQKLSLSALAIDKDMSEVGILIAEDALSQVKRNTCTQCRKILPEWFFVEPDDESSGIYCMSCIDDFPYPEPMVSEDDYVEKLKIHRAAQKEMEVSSGK